MAFELVNKKLRLYLSTDKNTHRKFYWFELKGDDLYWGSSDATKEAFCNIKRISDDSITFQAPDDFKNLEPSQTKYSYHQSGEFHIKRLKNKTYQLKELVAIWNKKDKISEPQRIFTLITKPLFNYPIEKKKLIRERAAGRSILIEGKAGFNRLFMEFFLIPKGKHLLPKFILDIDKSSFNYINKPLSMDIILFIRYVKIANFEHWHPDKEIIFLEISN